MVAAGVTSDFLLEEHGLHFFCDYVDEYLVFHQDLASFWLVDDL